MGRHVRALPAPTSLFPRAYNHLPHHPRRRGGTGNKAGAFLRGGVEARTPAVTAPMNSKTEVVVGRKASVHNFCTPVVSASRVRDWWWIQPVWDRQVIQDLGARRWGTRRVKANVWHAA